MADTFAGMQIAVIVVTASIVLSGILIGVGRAFSYKRIENFGVEEFFASGVIVLSMEREEMVYNRVMLVRKMRGTAIDLRVRKFNIDSKSGIILYG